MSLNTENLTVECRPSGDLVLLSPNDTLMVMVTEEKTNLPGGGVSVQQLSIKLEYAEVLALLKKARRQHRTRKSKTPESKMSRQIGLLARAIATGKWSNGRDIDRGAMGKKLIALLDTLEVGQIHSLTSKAKQTLLALRAQEPSGFLRPDYNNFCLRVASLLS